MSTFFDKIVPFSNYEIESLGSFEKIPLMQSLLKLLCYGIDHIQHKKIQEKLNPFHGRFPHKTARFWFVKLMNI